MKKISEHLGQIIVALAGVALLVAAVVVFKAPIGEFYNSMVSKEVAVADTVLEGLDNIDLGDLSGGGNGGEEDGSGGVGAGNSIVWKTTEYAGLDTIYDEGYPAAFKISALTPTVAELDGGMIVVIDNGSGSEVFSVALSESTFVEVSEDIVVVEDSFYFVSEDNSSLGEAILSKGVWVNSDISTMDWTVTISW